MQNASACCSMSPANVGSTSSPSSMSCETARFSGARSSGIFTGLAPVVAAYTGSEGLNKSSGWAAAKPLAALSTSGGAMPQVARLQAGRQAAAAAVAARFSAQAQSGRGSERRKAGAGD